MRSAWRSPLRSFRWFGSGEPSTVATSALGVFLPTVVNTYAAVDHLPRNLTAMAQSFGVPARDNVRKVMVPAALAGFRISSSIALILVVAAEMIGAQVGIGASVLTAGNVMQTDQLIAGALASPGARSSISALERRLLRWR